VVGEGGYLVLLESASVAERRGARAYGEILGVGLTSSSTPLNQWPAEPSGLVRAMNLALADAGLAPDAIAAVFATANGSPKLDRMEAASIHEVFGSRAVPVASLKGAIGESSAAGAAGLVVGLLSIASGTLVPTVGFAEADPACALSVSNRAQRADGDIFLVNSVASGGTQGCLVVRAGPRA
jgi:3-oxoacyl-(acyl-carrier-protein) synthase